MTEQVKKISPRRRARECAVQALYSWAISQNSPEIIELNFMTEQDMKGVDTPYFRKLFRQTVENVEAVERTMQGYLDRSLAELDPVEKAVLRLAVYEPYKVVINEAIEVAKVFGADESHKYINGVLDKIAPLVRR